MWKAKFSDLLVLRVSSGNMMIRVNQHGEQLKINKKAKNLMRYYNKLKLRSTYLLFLIKLKFNHLMRKLCVCVHKTQDALSLKVFALCEYAYKSKL